MHTASGTSVDANKTSHLLHLLQELSAVLFSRIELQPATRAILQKVMPATGSEQALLFSNQVHPEKGLCSVLCSELGADATKSGEPDYLHDLRQGSFYEKFPELFCMLASGEVVYAGGTRPNGLGCTGNATLQDPLTALLLPMFSNGTFRAVMLLRRPASNCWETEEIQALKVLAGMFSGYLLNHERMEAQQKLAGYLQATINSGNSISGAVSATGKLLYVSQPFEEALGYKRDEITGHDLYRLLHPRDSQKVLETFGMSSDRQQEPATVEHRVICKNGQVRWLRTTISGFGGGQGQGTLVAFVSEDISGQKKLEQAVARSQQQFERVIENTPQVFWSIHYNGHQQVWHLSGSVGKPLLFNNRQLQENPALFEQLLLAEDRPLYHRAQQEILQKKSVTCRLRIRCADGSICWLEISGRLSGSGQVLKAEGVATDVTEKVLSETALRESESRFRSLVESLAGGVAIVDCKGVVTYCNDAGLQLLRCTRNQFVGKYYFQEHRRPVLEGGVPLTRENHPVGRAFLERRLISNVNTGFFDSKKNEYVWLLVNANPLLNGQGGITGVICSFMDITRLNQLKQERQKLYHDLDRIFHNPNHLFWGYNLKKYQVEYVSEGVERLLSLTRQELLAANGKALFSRLHPEDTNLVQRVVKQLRQSREPVVAEYRVILPDGAIRWMRDMVTPSFDQHGKLSRMDGIASDITDKKELAASLQASLKAKEALIAEIHHRVKNNLTIIHSLLDMQKEYAGDVPPAEAFEDCQHRVMAMAMIHENLYRSDLAERVNVSPYFDNLAHYITSSFAGQQVALEMEVPDLYISMDDCLSLGLVLNELLTNSYKHAFEPGSTNAKITVKLQPGQNEGLVLQVKDNGCGLPAGFSLPPENSMGMELVDIFTDRAGGSLQFSSTPGKGTLFTIASPKINFTYEPV